LKFKAIILLLTCSLFVSSWVVLAQYNTEGETGTVEKNEDWTPVTQTINDVEVVLVPKGCFMMGSSVIQVQDAQEACHAELDSDLCNTVYQNELPEHEVCFDKPFWIDRYEVTLSQFDSQGGEAEMGNFYSFEGVPRMNVGWLEAWDFCILRGGRLPTEAEWEYAARGPDGLIYPWGNEFVAENVVDNGAQGRVSPVGSSPDNSWVGAYDMSSNAMEWVSTIYDQERFPYPYIGNDGRENPDDLTSPRIMRGGLAGSVAARNVRSARRSYSERLSGTIGIGFRCVHDYEYMNAEQN